MQRCQKHLCCGVSTQERSSALTFPHLATFALPRAERLLLDLHSKTPSPSQAHVPFGRKALYASHLHKALARTWQNRAPRVVSHLQPDSLTLKRLKDFRILPSIASGPPRDFTPTMAFFHLFGTGLCAQEMGGHQQLSESMLKKPSSHPTLSTFTSMKFLEHPPLPAKTAEIIKYLHTQTPSPKQLVQVKLFPITRTGIRWTTGPLGLLM